MQFEQVADKPQSIASLGPIAQICWVAKDLRVALDFWTTTMGVGPFFLLEHQRPTNVKAYGRPIEIDYSAALGSWQDMSIEIIQQHSPEKTFYTDWLDRGQTGPHHLLIDVPDMTAAETAIVQKGGLLVYEKSSETSSVKYFDLGAGGPYIEIGRAPPGAGDILGRIREASRNWDGSDPIRSFQQL